MRETHRQTYNDEHVLQQHQQQQHQEVTDIRIPVPMNRGMSETQSQAQSQEPVKELPIDQPAYVDPPYIVKDEDGR